MGGRVKVAAFICRVLAAVISFLYLVLLLPHFSGLTLGKLAYPWTLAGLLVAFLWLPVLLLERWFRRERGSIRTALSFAPLLVIAAFFMSLFQAATTVR